MRAIQTVVLEGNPKGTVQRNAKTQHCLLSLSEGTSASEAANLNLTDLHHADLRLVWSQPRQGDPEQRSNTLKSLQVISNWARVNRTWFEHMSADHQSAGFDHHSGTPFCSAFTSSWAAWLDLARSRSFSSQCKSSSSIKFAARMILRFFCSCSFRFRVISFRSCLSFCRWLFSKSTSWSTTFPRLRRGFGTAAGEAMDRRSTNRGCKNETLKWLWNPRTNSVPPAVSAKGLFSFIQCSLELARPLFFPLSMASGYSLAVCQQLPASHSNENKNVPK